MSLIGGLSMAKFWGPKLWTVCKVLLLGLVIACLCGMLWFVVKTVFWASLMPQLVLRTELSLLTFG